MKYTGLIRMSGSLAGITASTNRGGDYLRARVTPTNPNTMRQSMVRTILQQLADRWGSVLTQAQRDAWDVFATNYPGMVGTGINAYVTNNMPRAYAAGILPAIATIGILDTAPVVFSKPGFTAIEPANCTAAPGSSSNVSIAYDDTEEWHAVNGSAMLFYQSLPQNASRKAYNGSWRLCHIVQGDATTPPTSPAVFSSPHVLTVPQRVWTKVALVHVDGRVSAPQVFDLIVASP